MGNILFSTRSLAAAAMVFVAVTGAVVPASAAASAPAVRSAAAAGAPASARPTGLKATASTGTGTVIASPNLNIRQGPVAHELQAPIDYQLPYGTQVDILCTITSDYVTGPYGKTNIWDMIAASEGHGDFASDAWIYTGTNNPVAPPC